MTIPLRLTIQVILLDEIDSLLMARSDAATAHHDGALVNEFLAAWDGVASGGGRVLVVGTTNRHGSMVKSGRLRSATAGNHGLLRLHLEA